MINNNNGAGYVEPGYFGLVHFDLAGGTAQLGTFIAQLDTALQWPQLALDDTHKPTQNIFILDINNYEARITSSPGLTMKC